MTASSKGRWLYFALATVLITLTVLGTVSARPQHTQLAPGTPEEQVIDVEISEMLAAWQIGDITLLKSYYADDVMVVSGSYEPALAGWSKYLQAYLRQRERVTNVRLDRSNTYVHVAGNFAWATYQWDFSANVDGAATDARGQATLVFQKRDGHWLIVHNHTSMVGESTLQRQPKPTTPPPPAPAP